MEYTVQKRVEGRNEWVVVGEGKKTGPFCCVVGALHSWTRKYPIGLALFEVNNDTWCTFYMSGCLLFRVAYSIAAINVVYG